MRRFRLQVGVLCSLGLAAACGSDESPLATATLSDGGSSATGGAVSNSGGAGNSGGSRSSGGSNAGGGGTGDASGAGGASSNTGGAISNAGGAGGAPDDGGPDGSISSGGAASTGGASGTGGANTGGASGTGGSAGSGGASTGGAPNDGGPTSDIYVNPVTGDDNNTGFSLTDAVKTIRHAAQLSSRTRGIETIHLANGTYDAATQIGLALAFSPRTTVTGESSSGVVLLGTPSVNGVAFPGGGALHNVTFDTFDLAVQAGGAPSTFDMSGVRFRNVSRPMQFGASVVAMVDASGPGPFAVPPATGFAPACLLAADSTNVTFRGATFQNVPGNDGQVFLAREEAKLTIDATVIDTSAVRAITIFDNADVVLKDSRIHRVSLASKGLPAAAIYLGEPDSMVPVDPSLDVQGSDISMNQVPGISLVVHATYPSTPVVKFTDSHVDDNSNGPGFLVSPSGGVHSGVVNTVQAVNSTFNGNTGGGISAVVGSISITGGEFSGNGSSGIALTEGNYVSSLKVRGTVKIDANGGHGISFAGSDESILDLGKTGDPGGITFTGVAATRSAVNLLAATQGHAIGNTWIPSVQGASAAGAFTSPLTIVGPASGANVTVAGGGSLVVAE
jgi:hypothetical protein